MARPLLHRLIWPVLIVVPTLFLCGGAFFMVEAAFFLRNSVAVTGEVVSVAASRSRGSGTDGRDLGADIVTYVPTIRYTDRDGREVEAETHLSSSAYDFRPGDSIDVRYLPEEPGTVRIDSFWSLWLLPGIFTLMGGVFLPLVLWIRRIFRRSGQA